MRQHCLLPLTIAIACALASPGPARAQTAGAPVPAAAADATALDELIVTATRTEISLADSLVPAQVIEREEIERSQARSLPELLRGRAGINLSNQGGAGKLTSLFLRGAESDHVLVLIDGIRVGSATAGLASFQDFPVDQIERIEIVRGPRSSLYGSEAIGGVIQIFTRRGGAGSERRLRVGVGSNGLREASAGIGQRGARGWIGADFALQRTDGIDACRGAGAPVFRGCFADEPDRDGYRSRSLSLRGGLQLTDALLLEGNALGVDADNEYDGSSFGGNEAENGQAVVGGKLGWTPSARLRITGQAGRASDTSDAYYAQRDAQGVASRRFVNTFDTRRDSASLQVDATVRAGHTLSVGADWQRDAVTSTTAYIIRDRDNAALFAEYQGRIGAQHWQASLRHDDNAQFGGHTTGSVGWGLALGRGARLKASYGTGFKAPTFNDLYFPFFGNPQLQPEQSKSLNIGIAQQVGRSTWTLDAFETRIDALTGYDSQFRLVQAGQARIRGLEFTLATVLAGWDVSTQLTRLDPRDRTPAESPGAPNDYAGNWLPRRARDTARLDLDRGVGAWRIGTTVQGSGPRYDDAANQVRLGGHATVDLRLEYALHPQWTLQARASNVLDRRYETIAWYNQPGREYGLSLRYAASR